MEQKTSLASRLPLVPLIAVAIGVLIVALAAWSALKDTTGERSDVNPQNVTAEHGIVHGSVDAPVKVVVYADFRCPACAQFDQLHNETLDVLVAEDAVSVENRTLSFLDQSSQTQYSTRAMNAYLAVASHADAETAEAFRKALLEVQPNTERPESSDNDLVSLAEKTGVDGDALDLVRDDVKSLAYGQWIVNANDDASKDGVNRTPYVMVDGEVLEDPFTELTAALAAAAEAHDIDVPAILGVDDEAKEEESK